MENDSMRDRAQAGDLLKKSKNAWETLIRGGGMINLHPMHGMKVVKATGDDRKFVLSEKAKKRHAAAKASKKNYVAPAAARKAEKRTEKKLIKALRDSK